jgi:hypothetical protein
VALLRLVLFGLGLFIVSANCYAADVTLAWDPNQEANLAGYGVYFSQGTDGPPYDFFGFFALADLSDPNSPVFTVTGLQQDAPYYFAVTAYDTSDIESAYSASVCAQVGDVVTPCDSSTTPTTPTNTGGASNATTPASSSSGGGGGGGCFIQSIFR